MTSLFVVCLLGGLAANILASVHAKHPGGSFMSRLDVVLAFALLAGATTTARAQAVNAASGATDRQSASLGAGFDHGAVVEAGYGHPLALPSIPAAQLVARLALPSSPSPADGGVELGVAAGFVTPAGWGVSPRLLATVRWVDGELLGIVQTGFVAGVAGGYFRPRWSVALDLAWDKSLAMRVSPTDRYRMETYAGASTGWYGSGGGTLRAGVIATATVTRRLELGVRAGMVGTEELRAPPGMPFYGVVGATTRF